MIAVGYVLLPYLWLVQTIKTSNSAIAERPCNALCPSVVIPRTESFIIVISALDHLPLRTIKCYSVVFGVKLKLLIHFVVVSRQKQTPSVTNDYSVINSLVCRG